MIRNHYEKVKENIGSARLCIVTKKRSVAEIMSYYEAGERDFAENKAQELLRKVPELPEDIRWHFIGHLQRNKVKDILPHVSLIQSLDSLRLAEAIEKEAAKLDRRISVLTEFHLAGEDTEKTGLPAEEAESFISTVSTFPHLQIEGIMVMGPHTGNTERIEEVFRQAHDLYIRLQEKFGEQTIHILSMGMSSDYQTAAACGSTMVRIGTYLFEEDPT